MSTGIQYGDNLRGFVKLESSYGVPPAIVAADAFKARMIQLADADRRREDPGDCKGTFSVLERAEARHAASWSCTVLLRPSGSLGVVSDVADLWELALGTETPTGSTSVVYTQLANRTGLSATIWADLGDVVEFVRGAVCSNVKITWGGDDWIVIVFSGPGKEFGETADTTADGIGTTTTTMTMADMDYMAEYSLVQIGDDTNTAAGYYLTTLDYTAETAIMDTATSWPTASAIKPFLPTPTYAGSLVPFGTKVTTSIDGGSTTQRALGGEINLETGMGLLNEEEGSTSPTEPVSTGKWKVSGTMKIVVREGDVNLFSESRRQVQKDCRWTFGDTATYIMQIDSNKVEFDPSPKSIPDSGMVTIDMPFEALGTTGEDNLAITMI